MSAVFRVHSPLCFILRGHNGCIWKFLLGFSMTSGLTKRGLETRARYNCGGGSGSCVAACVGRWHRDSSGVGSCG